MPLPQENASSGPATAVRYAYVKFLADGVKTTVLVDRIKQFNPEDTGDFNPRQAHLVKWQNPGEDDYGEYKAQVLALGASRDDINETLSKTRLKVPKVLDTTVEDSSDEDDIGRSITSIAVERRAQKSSQQSAHIQRLKKVVAEKVNSRKQLFSGGGVASPSTVAGPTGSSEVQSTKVRELKRKLEDTKHKLTEALQENKRLRSLNMGYQDRLFKSLDRMEERLKFCSPSAPRKTSTPSTTPCRSTSKEVVVLTPSGPSTTPRRSTSKEVALTPSGCSPVQSTPTSTVKVYDVEDGQVFLGANIWMDEEEWDDICTNDKSSIFAKDLAVGIWGRQTLKDRSVGGKFCPKYKGVKDAKPGLTPAKLNAVRKLFRERLMSQGLKDDKLRAEESRLGRYLSEKIQDLNRKKPTPKNVQPTKENVKRTKENAGEESGETTSDV